MPKKTWHAYCQYLREWADSHTDAEFEDCCPVCYAEFLDNEWKLMQEDAAATSAKNWRYLDVDLNPAQLPSREELLAALKKQGSCWSAISELGARQHMQYDRELVLHYPISDSNYAGGFISPVQEGILFIPYDEIDKVAGEKLLLHQSYLLDEDACDILASDIHMHAAELSAALQSAARICNALEEVSEECP